MTTVLVVTAAYAAIYALLNALGATGIVAAVVVGFFTAIALGQAVLFRGEFPRLASLVVGSFYYAISVAIAAVANSRNRAVVDLPEMLIFHLIVGVLWGYLGGVLVGTVFMFVHKLRTRFAKQAADADSDEHETSAER